MLQSLTKLELGPYFRASGIDPDSINTAFEAERAAAILIPLVFDTIADLIARRSFQKARAERSNGDDLQLFRRCYFEAQKAIEVDDLKRHLAERITSEHLSSVCEASTSPGCSLDGPSCRSAMMFCQRCS